MTDVREKLAGHLYRSGLAVAPAPIVAARLAHASDLTWDLGGGVIKVTIGGITTSFTTDGSVADLLSDLLLVGVTSSAVDPVLSAVPAAALLEGWGSDASAEDDALRLFTTSLWALLDTYGSELNEAEVNLVAALDQLYMNTADGEILDVWSSYFAVPRKPDEGDAAFYLRIVREVLRPRVNRYAIEAAIRDDTGLFVSLREPHREIFRLSVSALSGGHHLQDGSFFTWNVFQPIYHSPLTVAERDRVLAIIERNRPAGCLIVGPDVQPPIGYVEGSFGQSVGNAMTLVDSFGEMPFQPGLLSATLFLSNYRERPNSSFYWRTYGTVTRSDGVDSPLNLFAQRLWTGAWDGSLWNRPSVFSVVTQHPA